ncbi:nucleoside/nucleotide kinase family protein [Paraburkholderia phosphatilytica]|uniref:nucleoside/nucleotide kinase family protein n=1 Tax=Paraburkholderia phosphatilytica TaxID=2282883 RepID=UPI000E51A2B9|nr:nucleoside/nucleotide kinase family protein [Paraburkholderia phosphatilytica]
MTTISSRYLDRLNDMTADGRRRILGLAGAPGAGKSTLAQAILEAFPGKAVVVPMDGFHLANVELARLGRASRKGAEDTFDSAGYVALLRRLREARAGETVYAPMFRREIEEPVASAIPVPPDVPLVVTEGNYLLLKSGHWASVRPLLDEVWYVNVDPELRRARLVTRHVSFGRSELAAKEWVDRTDEVNAAQIDGTRAHADVQFHWAA